jgi:cation-transporting ATPase 13A1
MSPDLGDGLTSVSLHHLLACLWVCGCHVAICLSQLTHSLTHSLTRFTMVSWTGKRITKISLFQEVNTAVLGKVGYEHFLFFFLYAVSLYHCITTIGHQHLEALTNAEERGIDLLDEIEKQRYEADLFLSGEKMDPKIAEAIAFRVPSAWLPSFWASIFFGLVVIFHSLMILGQKWSVAFRCFIRFRQVNDIKHATHLHVTPRSHQGKEELVELQKNEVQGIQFFEFHRRKYVYDEDSDTFHKVRCRVNYPENHYNEWTGIPDESIHGRLLDLHGANKFQMKSPAFMDLYVEQITSPFTVFQLFCMLLWCLDDYWQYSIFTLFMICSFEATTVFSRLKSIGTLKGMGNENRPIQVYRFGAWRESSTEELLPGDLFSLRKEKDDVIPCDALILRGGIVVNEATLTGESVPQMKDGICSARSGSTPPPQGDNGEEVLVNIKGVHKAHALFGGTRVLQVTSAEKKEQLDNDKDDDDDVDDEEGATKEKPLLEETVEVSDTLKKEEDLSGVRALPPTPDGGCLCYCTRTGFSSSQGKLVRMIENSTSTVRGDVRDTVLLLLFLLIFAVSASGYVLVEG